MDDRTNREGGVVRLLRLSVFVVSGAFLGKLVFSVVFEMRDNYSGELAAQLVGSVCGALCGLMAELLLRRSKPLSPRFSLKEMLFVIAIMGLIMWTLTFLD